MGNKTVLTWRLVKKYSRFWLWETIPSSDMPYLQYKECFIPNLNPNERYLVRNDIGLFELRQYYGRLKFYGL